MADVGWLSVVCCHVVSSIRGQTLLLGNFLRKRAEIFCGAIVRKSYCGAVLFIQPHNPLHKPLQYINFANFGPVLMRIGVEVKNEDQS